MVSSAPYVIVSHAYVVFAPGCAGVAHLPLVRRVDWRVHRAGGRRRNPKKYLGSLLS